MQHTTLCFLVREAEILLAMKKRGFGAGRWNGTGGKLLAQESAKQATLREAQEEIGVTPVLLEKVAELTFVFPEKSEWNQVCQVYICTEWRGKPVETEEMAPQWFALSDIPYATMWSDDSLWLPQVLAGKKLKAEFSFNAKQEMLSHKVEEIA